MKIHFRHACGVAACLLLFAGCDTLDDAINDALPEIGIADGMLGLGGEEGTPMSGSFSAQKSGGIDAVATFGSTETFADLNSGDLAGISSMQTTLALAVLTGNTSITLEGTNLPASLTITGTSASWTLSDAGGSTSGNGSTSANVVLTRAAGCAATDGECGYGAVAAAAIPVAAFTLNGTQAAQVFGIVGQSTPATTNTVTVTVTLTVSNPITELAGITSATIRVGEYDTTVQPQL